jgi:aquaporin Z
MAISETGRQPSSFVHAEKMEELKRRYSNILNMGMSAKTVMSEIIGVFGFVLMGTGAAAIYNAPEVYQKSAGFEEDRMVKEAIIGFAFGIGIIFMIFATAHNNSGQLNPAVTIGLISAGVCPLVQGLLNIAGQVIGALIASGVLKSLLPSPAAEASGLGANSVPKGHSKGEAFLGALCGHVS